MKLRPLLVLTAAAAVALPAVARADPSPGRVEVVNDAGAVVGGDITGADAIATAIARIRTGALARADDTRPWRVVVGAGTYGDAVLDEPNLTLLPSAGAAVTITTSTGTDHTGGECLDVTRGNVTVQGIACRSARDRGIEVTTPPAEGGVVLSQVTVDRAHSDGIAVIGGAGATIVNSVVTNSGRDGIALQKLTAPGPWVIQGGELGRNGDDGLDLVDDAQHVRVSGVTIDANRGNGIESDDAGSTDLVVDGARLLKNGGDGALLGGGGTALRVLNSGATGNGGEGVEIGRGSGFALQNDTFDGTNRKGDVAFSPDARAGGLYVTLGLLDTVVDLPGEPRGVIVRAIPLSERARLSRLPAGLVGFNRLVGIRDAGKSSTSVVTVRFGVAAADLAAVRTSALAVYEDDPPANKRMWQVVPGTRLLPGGQIEFTLTDAQIASGSDTRFATYGPLAPPNVPPVISAVYPAQGARVRGRTQLISAAVSDDELLNTGRFALFVDGKRRGGVSLRNGNVIFRIGSLAPGGHRATLLVVDQSGLRAAHAWTFTVLNGRPSIVRRRALPRPGSFVLTRGVVRLRVPVRDDQRVVRALTRVRVDGRLVRARLAHGRLEARVRLSQGRHRIVVRVADRDGAVVTRGWAFRTVRP